MIEVEINGQGYQIVSTHVQAEDGKEFALVRADQFKMIANLLDTNRKPEVPQFILGDLNTAKIGRRRISSNARHAEYYRWRSFHLRCLRIER